MWGQDVAKLGGVMQASAGLLEKHPGKITDAPLNEPFIMELLVALLCIMILLLYQRFSLVIMH